MVKKFKRALTSLRTSTMLAVLLFAALTVPLVMLQSMHAFAATPPLPCTEGNNNGCTELSPTPPEDLQSVPPNILLMFDDSGSMAYDYMPDWNYLSDTTVWGLRDSVINNVYYNPDTNYAPPPKADGTSYPNSPSLTGAYNDGFIDASHTSDVRQYYSNSTVDNGHYFRYGDNLPTTLFGPGTDYGPAVWGGGTPGSPGSDGSPGGTCPGGYSVDPDDSTQCLRPSVAPSELWQCNSGDYGPVSHSGDPEACRHTEFQEGQIVYTWYTATDGGLQCPGGSALQADNLCHYPAQPVSSPTPPTDPTPPTPDYKWTCPRGGSTTAGAPAPPSPAPECTTASGSRIYVWAFIYVVGTPVQAHAHFVVPNGAGAPAGGWCANLYPGTGSNIWNGYHMDNCVDEADTSGTAAPGGVAAGQNIANWFSYYRTRMLLSKSGLMTAFTNLDARYRFGFASINGNGKSNIIGPEYASGSSYTAPGSSVPFATFDDSFSSGGDSSNRLAVVQPFGDGTDVDSQKAKFWNWIANERPGDGTPLRKALAKVGQYYQTDQPWQTMPGDPGYTDGSTTQFACRAAYTILTTDGFWNGDDPGIGGMANAADSNGPLNTVPTGNVKQYVADAPFKGGDVGAGASSLADVATYYWERDLQSGLANEVSPSKADPASWQHMTTFTIGLGFTPAGIQPTGTTVPQVFSWANGGSPIAGFGWPAPASDNLNNIADLAHAAVNGHGDFFNVNNPADLAAAFAKALADIGARTVAPTTASVNASVLSLGAVAFRSGYSTGDWAGQFQAVTLKTDGTVDTILWKADALLDAAYHSPTTFAARKVYTDAYKLAGGTYTSFQLTAGNRTLLDTVESAGLQAPALTGGDDTLGNRISYLLGDNTFEGATYRTRTSILGAILHSDPVYVAGATGNYRNSWPTLGSITPPEIAAGAEAFDTFVHDQATRAGVVYVGANDGMLHAFNAPVPQCSGTIDADGNCPTYTFAGGADEGQEAWAFVPRAVYANLGNLTQATDFHFLPTVDGTPVTRDVFFSSDKKWHTILAGGVGLGGRGVYGLDITAPTTFAASDVLWEFDADMAPASGCTSIQGSATDSIGCRGTDLGYTVSQPNVARLANGKWVVLVPNGYFPDCNTPDTPARDTASCEAIAAEAPKDSAGNPYSALFVLDAQTGKMIAELKTPSVSGVTSFGLARPVLGDYNSDQVDDVAFAGDVQGNLWRFDLSDSDPANWKVSLVYQGVADAGGHQGIQPITTMPRLFPDADTNRFMVLFGTGKYLGVGDNSDSNQQGIYAVRDVAGTTYTQTDLTQQFLHETTVPAGETNAGAVLRCVTGSATGSCTSGAAVNTVPASAGGWFINLYTTDSAGERTDAGERVVVNPGAVFASNTVIFESLITGAQNTDACNPTTQGAVLAVSAGSGAPAVMSSLGGSPVAGGRIANARTSGSLPVVSALGGGKAYLPGATLEPAGTPLSIDAPVWRRRSWRVLLND